MENYNSVQGLLNFDPNQYYQGYMKPIIPEPFQNGACNQDEIHAPVNIADQGFQPDKPMNLPEELNLIEEKFVGNQVAPPNLELKPKHKRRSKNEQNGRDYICGCGKTYLSYPALYTHIKTKHGGKNPTGTDQGPSVRGRGRPKKVLFE